MTPEKILLLVSVALVSVTIVFTIYKKLPKIVKKDSYSIKWRELQKRCANSDEWKQAIIDADNLLDTALKNKRVKGSTMGERLVAVQRIFTDNDSVWFGHKLRGKIDADPEIKLKKQDVKRALLGIGRGLKDLGAL